MDRASPHSRGPARSRGCAFKFLARTLNETQLPRWSFSTRSNRSAYSLANDGRRFWSRRRLSRCSSSFRLQSACGHEQRGSSAATASVPEDSRSETSAAFASEDPTACPAETRPGASVELVWLQDRSAHTTGAALAFKWVDHSCLYSAEGKPSPGLLKIPPVGVQRHPGGLRLGPDNMCPVSKVRELIRLDVAHGDISRCPPLRDSPTNFAPFSQPQVPPPAPGVHLHAHPQPTGQV